MELKGHRETSVTNNLHCVTSQKSENIIYNMAEACNHVSEVK